MSTEPDLRLTTAAGLETYLAPTRYASTSIETVSGGHTGFLYRVVLKEPLETGEKTVIVKHTLEYAAQSIIDIANGGTPGPGRITLNVERMASPTIIHYFPFTNEGYTQDFEHEALELVNSNPELSTVVRVPRVHTYDPHTHTLIMSDVAPCRLLSSMLQEADDELVSRIGRALGEFMGKFHKWTSLPEQAAARKRFLENTTSREDVLRIRWQLALAAAKKYHVERAWMEEMYLAGMQDGKSGTVICMADFWFDNILVSTQHDLAIWIVDWETTRTARPELDVAHFATAAYSLVHVHRPIPLMREFTKAYKAHMDLDETSMGTHAGRDMLSFGVVMPWIRHRDESIKQPIAQLGVELLEAAHTGDQQALRKNLVLADIQQMSLLRQALRTRASRSNIRPEESPPPKKSYAKSIKSVASVKTLAASLASFYTSKVPGSVGTSSPKRRRSPRSELGKPPFASKNPELKWVDGVEACDEPMVSGVSTVRTLDERVSLVVHHFGEPGERGVVFYGATSVSGQVRLVASKPDPIESIEVWVTLKSSCTFSSSEPNALELRATLYRNSGPLEPGTYVFVSAGTNPRVHMIKKLTARRSQPFTFDPFPESVVVRQEEKKNVTGRPLARVLLPPSYHVRAPHWMGRVEYEMGMVIKRRGLKPNDYIELPLVYRPRHRLKPVPPIPIPFPLIPTRDDWPLERETIGGWSLTPFGGRGRWNHSEAVEVEGLLGIACPLALVAGSKLRISILLWGTSSARALLSPDAVRLRLVRAHVMGLDALSPSSRAHTSRIVFEEERWDGVVWADGERERVIARKDSGSEVDSGVGLPDDHPRLVEYTTQAPDPPEEDEDEFPGTDEVGNTIKLHGSVHVPHDAVPSFRYKNMAVEYLVQVIVSHRDYNHVSPNGPGIVGEAPVWVVGPAPEQVQDLDLGRERSKKRMVGRSIVSLPKDVKRMPVVQGGVVRSEQS